MLELKNVSKYYGGKVVSLGLRNISAKFNKNEIVAITGESGAGKSTFLNVISFMDTYEAGEILFNDNETSYFNKTDMDLFRKNHIQYIPQSYNIIEAYTVLENVMMPLLLKNIEFKDAKEKALEIIKKVGLENRANHKGVHLSGGEKQRCVIARALATDCEILACDEPTGNLDSETGIEIMQLIKEIAKDKLVFIVTHNFDQVREIATRQIVISDGEIKEDRILQSVKSDSNNSTEMEMSEVKLCNKSFAFLLRHHIKCTPHKFILSTLISLIFFFCTLFFSLQCVKTYENLKYTDNPSYINTINNRLVVYNKDHSQIKPQDIEKIKGEKYYNAFYEDISLRFSTVATKKFVVGSYSKHYPTDAKVVIGSLPEKDDDLLLIVPQTRIDEFQNMLERSIGDLIEFESYFFDDVDMKLCGVASSSDISACQIYTKIDFSTYVSRLYLSQLKVTYERNGVASEISYSFIDGPTSNVIMVGPEKEELNDIIITIKNIYPVVLNNYEVIYDNTNTSPVFEIGIEIGKDFKFTETYEAVIYAENTEKAISQLTHAGYLVEQPGKNGIDYSSNDYNQFLIFLAISAVSIIVAMIITNAIVSKIIDSKVREYTILRSLGLLRTDSKKLVFGEIFVILITALLISLFGVFIINFFGIENLKLIGYFNWIVLVVFIIGFLFLLNRIYTKVKKKLLNQSVSQILSNEVLRK